MIPSIITERQAQIDALCRQHHVRRLELFGSATTEQWDPAHSDLDFLVKFGAGARFTTHGDLEAALRQLFDREIDLIHDVEFKNPYFRQSVENSRTHLWGELRQPSPENGVRVSSDQALKYLWDIRCEIGYLQNTIAGLDLDTVQSNMTLLRSFQMHLMIIGEALNQLSSRDSALFERISDARGYVGQRNVLIHQYTEIDWDKVWQTATVEAPLLLREVDALIGELDSEEGAE